MSSHHPNHHANKSYHIRIRILDDWRWTTDNNLPYPVRELWICYEERRRSKGILLLDYRSDNDIIQMQHISIVMQFIGSMSYLHLKTAKMNILNGRDKCIRWSERKGRDCLSNLSIPSSVVGLVYMVWYGMVWYVRDKLHLHSHRLDMIIGHILWIDDATIKIHNAYHLPREPIVKYQWRLDVCACRMSV